MATSPTQRSLKELRERGYIPWVVESFNYFTKQRKDLYGFIDILAIHKDTGVILGVQTTSGSHLSSHKKKIESSEYYELVGKSSIIIELHAWRQLIIGKFKNGNPKRGWVNKIIKL